MGDTNTDGYALAIRTARVALDCSKLVNGGGATADQYKDCVIDPLEQIIIKLEKFYKIQSEYNR